MDNRSDKEIIDAFQAHVDEKRANAYAARNASLQHELRATQDAAAILYDELGEIKRINNNLDASFTRCHNKNLTLQADVEALQSANRDITNQRDYALTELKQLKMNNRPGPIVKNPKG